MSHPFTHSLLFAAKACAYAGFVYCASLAWAVS